MLSAVLASATIDSTLQMQLGNPSHAAADTNNANDYLIQRTIEAISYNNALGEPNWASWDLTAGDANGAANRQDSYANDTNLPASFHQVQETDYQHSGYDRGHLCPSADRTDSTNDNNMTFLMSNMMPQSSDNNEVTWEHFETYCRNQCYTNNYELLVICGPSGFTGAKINTNGYVWIPQYTWKIVVVAPPGVSAVTNRITATNRVIAIKVPNTNGISANWQDFITSANQIQVDTGLNFFSALPPDVATALRAKVDGQTNPPPGILAFSPTNGAAGTSVVITGTNFSLASAVAFNGAGAAFVVNSSNQITATVPTNAGSGLLSVTTPSGTAISASSFTVFGNGGGTVYSGILAGWDVSTLPGGLNNYGPSPYAATTNAPNVAVMGLTRGSGVKQSSSGGMRGWGGTGFTNTTPAAAIASNLFVTFGFGISNGYRLSFTSVSRMDFRRSGMGPTNGVLQFQVGNGAFTDLTNLTYSAAGSGATNAPLELSNYATLQNVGAGTNVTFRLVNYNAGDASGTWYVYDNANSPAPDLVVQGTVTQIVTTNPPAIAPVFSLATFTNHQFQFTVTGTAGSNYVVQATTNLTSPNWIPVVTNPAPFVFTESNVDLFSQRFYRAVVAP